MENENNNQNGKFLNKIGNKLVEETHTNESSVNLNKVNTYLNIGIRRVK